MDVEYLLKSTRAASNTASYFDFVMCCRSMYFRLCLQSYFQRERIQCCPDMASFTFWPFCFAAPSWPVAPARAWRAWRKVSKLTLEIGWNYIHGCSLPQIENLYILPAGEEEEGRGPLQFWSGFRKVNPLKVSNFKFKVISENSSEGKRWSLQSRGKTRKRT